MGISVYNSTANRYSRKIFGLVTSNMQVNAPLKNQLPSSLTLCESRGFYLYIYTKLYICICFYSSHYSRSMAVVSWKWAFFRFKHRGNYTHLYIEDYSTTNIASWMLKLYRTSSSMFVILHAKFQQNRRWSSGDHWSTWHGMTRVHNTHVCLLPVPMQG